MSVLYNNIQMDQQPGIQNVLKIIDTVTIKIIYDWIS